MIDSDGSSGRFRIRLTEKPFYASFDSRALTLIPLGQELECWLLQH
jgi:hypothetical protein